MTISIKNLNAVLGAEVSGIDLAKPLVRDNVKTIEDVWRERLVVVFHGQKLSDPQLIAFSKNFGELDPPGPNPYGEPFNKEHPELNVISNVVQDGKPIGNLGDGEAVWHGRYDICDVPPKAASSWSGCTNISRILRMKKFRRTCWNWRPTSSRRGLVTSSLRNLKTNTRTRSRN